MGIFKTYDIRGRYPEELDEKIAYRVGRAFVTFTQATDVMVGYDARTHSPLLHEALVRGLTDQGANVTDIGLVTTPQTIAMHVLKKHAGAIMVTASHLDAPMNGFKMYTRGGRSITAYYGMPEMEALVTKERFAEPSRRGTVAKATYCEDYVKAVIEHAPHRTLPGKHFVVDCSNGSVGSELLLLRGALTLDIDVINDVPDGTFPHHSPNPIAPGAERQAAERVRATGAAGGCIFDADADRITFLDEQGNPIHPNVITCLIATELLRTRPGRAVAYDLISSRVVPETIMRAGGVPLRTRVGRNVLVDDMRRENAIFGGESSSHMIYSDLAYADCTLLSMLLVFNLVERSGKPLSVLTKGVLRYPLLPEKNYRVTDVEGVLHDLLHAFPEARIDRLDGLALVFDDGWIVVRPSNTEPVLRLRAEANTTERLAQFTATTERIITARGGTPLTNEH
jgi:phosphomannomutase